MKVTKFSHACLLVEDGGKTILIDPGNFAWDSGRVNLKHWPKVDEIVVTHEHGDHFHDPFVEELIAKFPDAMWVTNPSVAEKLRAKGATNVTTDSTDSVKICNVPHEKLPAGMGDPPANIQADILGTLTHPGDSVSSKATLPVLAMPFIAPWGSMTEASDAVLRLKPKAVFPIHDALWKEDVRDMFYGWMKAGFEAQGIAFIIPVEGEPFEI
jgi:L-ascorbate metabolism protein UlaG (beta-lactamase superfamily)